MEFSTPMKNTILFLTVLQLLITAQPAFAQFGVAWRRSPTVVVIGDDSDIRQKRVEKALAFWNKTLEAQGTSFRLGPIVKVNETVPEQELAALSDMVVGRAGRTVNAPAIFSETMAANSGDILIYLGNTPFVSFAGPFGPASKRVVGIRTMSVPPLSLPNVAQNVITHELGHSIGVGHNADASSLMCGRPSSCRPDAFMSSEEKLFPLTEIEYGQLQNMYPSTWKAIDQK